LSAGPGWEPRPIRRLPARADPTQEQTKAARSACLERSAAGVYGIEGITEEPVRARASEQSVIAGSTTDDIVTAIAADHVIPAEALDDVRTWGADDDLSTVCAHDGRRQSVTRERWHQWRVIRPMCRSP
jgi:hypothetical protein